MILRLDGILFRIPVDTDEWKEAPS